MVVRSNDSVVFLILQRKTVIVPDGTFVVGVFLLLLVHFVGRCDSLLTCGLFIFVDILSFHPVGTSPEVYLRMEWHQLKGNTHPRNTRQNYAVLLRIPDFILKNTSTLFFSK